jgi:hypothetical protein
MLQCWFLEKQSGIEMPGTQESAFPENFENFTGRF